MKIAICDDQPKFLAQAMATIENVHKSLDLIIDEFTSGPALLARLEDVNYDLIILDIEMPFAVCIRACGSCYRKNIKIFVTFFTLLTLISETHA